MIILLIFATIIILLQLFITLNIKIEIENLKVTLPKINKRYTNNDNKILLKMYILKKIKIAQIDLKKINQNNQKFKRRMQEQLKKDKFNMNVINYFKNDIYILEKMDLQIFIGTEDAAITAISVGVIYSILGNALRDKIKDMEIQRYRVEPIYENKNVFKIKFDGIFTFKMANIIGIVKYLKRRVDKNDRTSYRRSYAYSNE